MPCWSRRARLLRYANDAATHLFRISQKSRSTKLHNQRRDKKRMQNRATGPEETEGGHVSVMLRIQDNARRRSHPRICCLERKRHGIRVTPFSWPASCGGDTKNTPKFRYFTEGVSEQSAGFSGTRDINRDLKREGPPENQNGIQRGLQAQQIDHACARRRSGHATFRKPNTRLLSTVVDDLLHPNRSFSAPACLVPREIPPPPLQSEKTHRGRPEALLRLLN